MIVPGGGITAAGYWKSAKRDSKYLFPVKALSIVFKNKFTEAFLELLQTQNKSMDKIYGNPCIINYR